MELNEEYKKRQQKLAGVITENSEHLDRESLRTQNFDKLYKIVEQKGSAEAVLDLVFSILDPRFAMELLDKIILSSRAQFPDASQNPARDVASPISTSDVADDFRAKEEEPHNLNEGLLDDGNPDTSWLAGKYTFKTDGGKNTIEAEINTRLPYLAFGKFFAQGEDADEHINNIHKIYIKKNCTPKHALKVWASTFLSPEDI